MYSQFLSSQYMWIPWVTVIDSGKPWKNIWLCAITHGNEPVGLEVFSYLIDTFSLQKKLLTGKVFCIAINIDAYMFFQSQSTVLEWRCLHHNMNRIVWTPFVSGSSEHTRFVQLVPIFDQLDVVLDMHSVPVGDDVIGITDEKFLSDSFSFFDVQTILVDTLVWKWSLASYFLAKNVPAFGVECGNHVYGDSFAHGVSNVLRFLSYYNCIASYTQKEYICTDAYRFLSEIIVATEKFHFVRDFSNFDRVSAGECIAVDGETNVCVPYAYDVYVWLMWVKPLPWQWNGFFFEKILL